MGATRTATAHGRDQDGLSLCWPQGTRTAPARMEWEGPGRVKFVDSPCSHGVGGTRTGEVRVGHKAAGQLLTGPHGVGGTRTSELHVGRKAAGQPHGVGGTRTSEFRVGRKAAGQLLTAWGGRDQDGRSSRGPQGSRTAPDRMGWEGPGRVKFVWATRQQDCS